MGFTSVQDILGKVLRQCNVRASGLEAYKIFDLWSEIVGEGVALHTKPVKIEGRWLYVEVADPLWLTQIKYMKLTILDKIEATLKKRLIDEIRFSLSAVK